MLTLRLAYMNDRVDWIRCLVLGENGVDQSFLGELDNSAFSLRAENGNATVTWKIDLPTREYAERHFHTFLTSFEADMFLQQPNGQRRELRPVQLQMRSGQGVAFGPVFKISVVGAQAEANHRRQYPWLHHRYEAVPLIAALVERYQRYRSGDESIVVVGYFCLSALEHSVPEAHVRRGLRDAFCEYFGVEREVRDAFGDLVSEVGTWTTARKIGPKHELRELSPAERTWLEAAMRLIIDRAGQ